MANPLWSVFPSKKQKEISSWLGVLPKDTKLYQQALTHRSINKKKGTQSERLEFLGDAVLDSIVSQYLFEQYPNEREGFLTTLRSKIVNREHLSHLCKVTGIATQIKYDRKISLMETAIPGNVFEAIIGAVYLDRGYGVCKTWFLDFVVKPHINFEQLLAARSDFKGELQKIAQMQGNEITYCTSEKEDWFESSVTVGEQVVGKGEGSSKKKAEQAAAQNALVEKVKQP